MEIQISGRLFEHRLLGINSKGLQCCVLWMGARGSLESGSGFGAKPWNTVGTWEEKIAQEALFINFSHCGNTPEAGAFIKSRFGLVWLWGSRGTR